MEKIKELLQELETLVKESRKNKSFIETIPNILIKLAIIANSNPKQASYIDKEVGRILKY